MKAYHGVTVLGLLVILFVLIFTLMLGINLAPAYWEHYEVNSFLRALSQEPNIKLMPEEKIRELMSRKMYINNITNIPSTAFIIEKKEEKLTLSVDYEVRVHMVANIDAILTFNTQAVVP